MNFKTKARIKGLKMKLKKHLIPLLSKKVNSNQIRYESIRCFVYILIGGMNNGSKA